MSGLSAASTRRARAPVVSSPELYALTLVVREMGRELAAGDRELVDLIGAVGETEGAQVGIGRGEVEVIRDAGSAVNLDRPVEHVQGDVGRGHLDRRDLGACMAVAD